MLHLNFGINQASQKNLMESKAEMNSDFLFLENLFASFVVDMENIYAMRWAVWYFVLMFANTSYVVLCAMAGHFDIHMLR